MKKIYLTSIILAGFAGSAFAQKLEKPKIDKMTGDTTLKTSEERIYTSVSWTGGESDILYAYVTKFKGIKFLVFHINITNGAHSSVFSVSKDSKAYIKLSDGNIIAMNTATSQISENLVSSGTFSVNTRGDAYPFYELTPELIAKLKDATIVMVRIETSRGNMDFEIKDKNSKVIGKEIGLI